MTEKKKAEYALTAYGFPHAMGYLKTSDGTNHPAPMSHSEMLQQIDDFGLAGIEVPLSKTDEAEDERFHAELKERDLKFISDYMAVLDEDAESFRIYLRRSAKLGAKVVRAILSRILCGDRRNFPGGWEAHMDALGRRLNEVLPCAEELGVCIAVENHQDATTEDLLRLAEMVDHHPSFGITLDAGNPLAVGQEPVEAARKLAHLIRHIHLKDYTIHFAPEGYRLVRCAAGEGVIDFPAILEIVRGNGHDVLPGIEIAAQATRTIPLLEDSWWQHYPTRPAAELIPTLRILFQKGRPFEEPYSSAWERGGTSEEVSREEWDVVTRSVEYFRALG